MDIDEAIKSLSLKFSSGNDIPVERADITREEWEAIKDGLILLRNELNEMELKQLLSQSE